VTIEAARPRCVSSTHTVVLFPTLLGIVPAGSQRLLLIGHIADSRGRAEDRAVWVADRLRPSSVGACGHARATRWYLRGALDASNLVGDTKD
jgi:hypothetical protein